jgi:hypothetical protein
VARESPAALIASDPGRARRDLAAVVERAVLRLLAACQRRALQRVLELVDELAVVGQPRHRAARGDDLLDGVVVGPHRHR